MRLNLRQLEAFNTVMTTGSVSQAAELLHISQPGVSSLIIKLEKHLEVSLFERRKGRLVPTPEAQYLSQEVKAIFDNIQNISHAMRNVQTLNQWQLRIACFPGPSLFVVPNIIADFIGEQQDVKVSIQTLYSHEVIEWVENHKHNIGLAEIQPEPANLEIDPIDLDCICALPKTHPLAQKEIIHVSDLDGENLVGLQPSNMTSQALRRALIEANCTANVRFETQVFASALSFVERGLGIAVVEPISAYTHKTQQPTSQIVYRPFQPNIKFKMGVFYPKNQPVFQSTKAFGQFLKQEILRLNDLSKWY